MIHNNPRIGNFTSSCIGDLMTNDRTGNGFGTPAFTYIEEKKMERKLGRSLTTEQQARSLSWGQLVEKRVFDILGLEYQLVSQESIVHPKINYWAGSPDANKFDKGKTVVDIKSPMTLKSFCKLVEPLYKGLNGIEAIEYIKKNHSEGSTYYWQLVSNSILTDSKYAELIIYVPYLSELTAIRDLASDIDDPRQYRFRWINNAVDDELPYLYEDGYYKNINVIRFEVPVVDKVALKDRVLAAGKLLTGPDDTFRF